MSDKRGLSNKAKDVRRKAQEKTRSILAAETRWAVANDVGAGFDFAWQSPVVGDGRTDKSAGGLEAPIRVLLADDHARFRNDLARLFNKAADIRVVGHAADGREAIELAAKLEPDVILMDIGMPAVNGIEATRVIHRNHPHIRILGLSMYADEEGAQAMREAGACAYRTKGCAAAELITAIYACIRPRA